MGKKVTLHTHGQYTHYLFKNSDLYINENLFKNNENTQIELFIMKISEKVWNIKSIKNNMLPWTAWLIG